MYEEKDVDKLSQVRWRVSTMVQDGALSLRGEGKALGFGQAGEETAAGGPHSSPPIKGKGNFSKASVKKE